MPKQLIAMYTLNLKLLIPQPQDKKGPVITHTTSCSSARNPIRFEILKFCTLLLSNGAHAYVVYS